MKLGFIITKSSHGGGEKMQQLLMKEMIERGHQVVIFTWEDSLLNDFNKSLKKVVLKRKSNRISQFFYEVPAVINHLKKVELNCLIIFGTNESFSIASYLSKTCSISTLRVDPRFPPHKKYSRIKRLLFMYLNDGVVFQTEKVRNYFPRKIQKNSICIPNPIIDELPSVNFSKKNEIVAVGRLSKEKNYEMLIKAFNNINCKNYTLNIYGIGSELNYLKSLAQSDRVIFYGNVRNIYQHICQSKIFVMCSDYEGMPNALIEGMAMGMACISTTFPSGAAEYLIDNNKNGLLIPTGDQEKLEKALSSLINSDELVSKLGKNAEKIRKRLNKNTIIDSWLKFIEIKKRK
jgi:glycosyltransferase involved in cell wall biosynthesis